MPGPLTKVVLSAPDAKRADALLTQVRTGAPDLRYVESLSLPITRPTFSLLVRGYDVSPP
jgi:hypothetical protein